MNELRDYRRFFGRWRQTERCAGQQFEGSVDELVAAFRQSGYEVTPRPIENGCADASALGVIRTWGSGWVDILPDGHRHALTDAVLAELTVHSSARAFSYDYDPLGRRWSHRLYRAGDLVDDLDCAGPSETTAGVDDRIEALLHDFRIRDWGIDRGDLARFAVPFPASAVVEAWFLRLRCPVARP